LHHSIAARQVAQKCCLNYKAFSCNPSKKQVYLPQFKIFYWAGEIMNREECQSSYKFAAFSASKLYPNHTSVYMPPKGPNNITVALIHRSQKTKT